MAAQRPARLHEDRRAAAMVEFVIVLVPLMTLFLALIELSRYAIAQLMLERAAGMAVRACAVIKDQPANCELELGDPGGDTGASGSDRSIRRAAEEGLRPWTDTNVVLDAVECRTQKPSGEDTLQIKAQFRCITPIVRDILCSAPRNPSGGTSPAVSTRAMNATARYAHQGASYDCLYANVEYALPGASGALDALELGGAWP